MKSIAVCVITCNTRDLLRECLRTVVLEMPDEIIVVDNGSMDGSREMVKAEFPSVKLLALEKNMGFGAASNRGIQSCTSEHIYLINADTRVKPGSVQALNRYLETHAEAAIIGPRMLHPDGSLQTSCFHFPTPLHVFLYISSSYKLIPQLPILKKRSLQKVASRTAMAVPWIHGAALAFRRQQIQSLGGFDESYFLYFEEVDLCYRLALQSYQMHFVPEAEIIHVGGGTTVQRRAWFYIEFFVSLARFYRKHYSTLLLTELVFIVKAVSLFKLASDLILLQVTRDAARRSHLEVNLKIHSGLAFSSWYRRSRIRPAMPA
jgi:GT2 family glycosyltransferase